MDPYENNNTRAQCHDPYTRPLIMKMRTTFVKMVMVMIACVQALPIIMYLRVGRDAGWAGWELRERNVA